MLTNIEALYDIMHLYSSYLRYKKDGIIGLITSLILDSNVSELGWSGLFEKL